MAQFGSLAWEILHSAGEGRKEGKDGGKEGREGGKEERKGRTEGRKRPKFSIFFF